MTNAIPLFEGLTGRQVDQAHYHFQEVTVTYGTPLILEGDEDASLIVVLDGELEMRTGDVVLWKAQQGELVGEIGLFSGGIRTATVETNTEATLLILDQAGYRELVSASNPVAVNIERAALAALAARLRLIDARIAELAAGTSVEHVAPSMSFMSRVASMFGMGGGSNAPALDLVEALAANSLFQGAERSALFDVAHKFQVEAYHGGHFLCTEGEPGDRMFLLVQGLVDVLVETQGDLVEPVATLDAGDAFGMGALIDHRPRTASCVCRGDVIVLTLARDAWHDVVAEPEAGRALRVAMVRALAEQLAYANGQLALLDLTSGSHDLTPLLMASVGVEAPANRLSRDE